MLNFVSDALIKLVRAEEYLLSLVETGRISIGTSAELLRTIVQDMQYLAQKHGVKLGPTTAQQRKSAETVRRIIARKK